MSAEQRRYPRVPFPQFGELEVRRAGATNKVAISIRSVSCEGVGVAATKPIDLVRGTSVTVNFSVGDVKFQLPGKVAWTAGGNQIGVHLQLALAGAAARHAYATWIVDTTKRVLGAA